MNKICVIGTSNSMMRDGYCQGLAVSKNIGQVDRFCIGGACSLLLPYELGKMDVGKYDVCIIDTCVTDDVHITSSLVESVDITLALMSAVRHIRQAGCIPMVLFLPRRRGQATKGPGYWAQLSVCRRMGVVFVDGYYWLHKKCSHLSDDELFLDEAHLKPEAAQLFGQFVARAISHNSHQFADSVLPSLPCYSVMPVGAFSSSGKTIMRQNSIRSDDFLQISFGEQVNVDLPARGNLCAFIINAPTSLGALEIRGKETISVCLDTIAQTRNVESGITFRAQLVALKYPLAHEGRIELRCVATHEGAQRLFNATHQPALTGEPRAEIGDLLTVAY